MHFCEICNSNNILILYDKFMKFTPLFYQLNLQTVVICWNSITYLYETV